MRLGVLDHGIGRGLQLGEIEAAVAQLELHGEAAGIADALDRRRREHHDARLLDRGEVAIELLEQRAQVLALAALAPILEHDIGDAGIGQRRIVVERGDAGDPGHVGDRGILAGDLADLIEHALGAHERGAVRQLHRHQDIALVLDREEAGRHASKAIAGGADHDQRDDAHQSAAPDHAADQPRIGALEGIIDRVERAEEKIALARRDGRPQPQRALGRLERGGVDGAEQRRGGDHQRELREHLAGEARDECGGQEHRHQHEGDADDRPEQLVHGLDRRLLRRQAPLDVMRRALDHHDGIVHDDADRQHDREQRRQVDRESERRHGRKRADDGDRHRGHGHQHGAPVLQEHHDHDQHQDRRLEQRLPYFFDGLAHERGGVEGNAVGKSRREAFRELIHLLGDFARHLERVRLERLKNADARRGLAVEREDLAVGLRTQLDPPDVAHVDHLPVRFGLDDDVLELADIVEAAGDVEGVLKSLRVRRRRHAELAGGDLLVLALERVDDVLGRERTRIKLVGIEPNPHRILAGPEDIDLAHARQARELRLQRDGRVIGEEQAVIALVRRDQRDELQNGRRFLLHRHALRLYRLRQLRERAGDAVLHQNLREVDVHSDLEGDDQRVAAVGGAPGLHVDHAVDAIDLLLDRQRDGVDHRARARAGVARGDGNGRRHHVGILGDRKPHERDGADHHHEDGEHVRQNGTLDEKLRDHGAPLLRSGRLGRRGRRRLELRIDLLARYGVEDAGYDHPLVRLQPTFDHAHLARRLTELHSALLDDAVGVDRQHIAARLIGAHGDLRDEQRLLRPQRHPHANEIARQQRLLGILEGGPHLERAGRLVDVGGDVVEQAFVRISGLGLQADLDRGLVDQVGDGHALLRQLCPPALHVPLAQIEPYPDRVELDDGRELARVVAADELADRYLARSHDPVEGCRNRGVAEIDLRRLHIGLGLQHVGARGVAVCTCLVEGGLGRDVLGLEFLLTGEFGFGIDQRRLGPLLRRLCLLELDLVGLRLDHEQGRPLLDRSAVLILDLLDVALHTRQELDGVYRRGVAGRLQIGRERLLQGKLDRHLRRRRRDEAVLLPARRQQREHPHPDEKRQPRLGCAQQIFGDASHLVVSATCASAASGARSFAHSMW